jgi:PAS domain S-box-containing protein
VDIGDLKRSELRLSAQYAVARVLSEADTLAEATPRILEAVGNSLDWQVGAIWEVDRPADTLRCVATWRAPGAAAETFEALTRETAFPRGIGLPGRVWESGAPAWIPDVTLDGNFPRAEVASREGLHGAVAFPIVLGREILGVIEFLSNEVRDPQDDLVAMMGAIGNQVGQFIERKGAEEEVRESESRKSAMVEGAIDCIITVDHGGKIVEFNPAAERTFGYSRDEVLGKDMAELIIPPNLRDRHREAFGRAAESRDGRIVLLRRLELTGMRADGTEFPVEVTVTRIESDGPPLFTAFLRDITERKRIEEERLVLLAMEQAARAETERARDRMAFVADAGSVLTSSLDSRKTLNKVARLAVPRLADWCSIDVLEEGELHAVTLAHADPDMAERAREWRRRWPPDLDAPRGAPAVIRTGRSELYSEVTDQLLAETARDEEQLAFLRDLGFRSAMIVPLTARGRTFGAITLVSSNPERLFDDEDLALAEELASRAAQALDNARLYQERAHVARALQQSLLPQQLPRIEWLEVGARYRAAGEGEVGGDFYDVFEATDGAVFAAIGDVQGKGPEAAAVTGLARYTIRAAATNQRNPSRILRTLNQAILNEGTDRFATVSLGRIQVIDGKAQFAVSCGGHPLPYIIRSSGKVLSAECAGNLLGVFPEPELQDYISELEQGDTVVFYTDGVTDEHARDVLFGETHLVPLLEGCAGLDADSVAGRIEEAVLGFREQEPRDDMAILVLRFTPGGIAPAGRDV